MKQKRNNLFKNRHRLIFIPFILSVILMFSMLGLTGCSEAERVTYNLSTQADNFNILRQVTVINCIANDVVFQMTGKMSITADVEDIDTNYVDKYKFTVNYNPKMWIPVDFEIVD